MADALNNVKGAGSGVSKVSGQGWRFVAAQPGFYQVSSYVQLFSGGGVLFPAGSQLYSTVFVNGAPQINLFQAISGVSNIHTEAGGSATFFVTAGGYIELAVVINAQVPSVQSSANSWITVVQLN